MSIVLIIIILLIVGGCCALLGGSNSNKEQVNYTSNGAKKCPNCGRELNASAINCGFCGYSFNSNAEHSDKTYDYSTSKKKCPNCGRDINASAINCGFCGYSFSSGTGTGRIRMNTKHINKNGLSFDCPEYYDIGKYPSSDEAYSSIVALSKNDRTSEIYVMRYRDVAFDKNSKRNMFLLKEFLKMRGYENVTEHRSLPYCFNAYAYSEVGRIKTTILFNFDYSYVINIVGNTISNYDMTEDIRIINDTI